MSLSSAIPASHSLLSPWCPVLSLDVSITFFMIWTAEIRLAHLRRFYQKLWIYKWAMNTESNMEVTIWLTRQGLLCDSLDVPLSDPRPLSYTKWILHWSPRPGKSKIRTMSGFPTPACQGPHLIFLKNLFFPEGISPGNYLSFQGSWILGCPSPYSRGFLDQVQIIFQHHNPKNHMQRFIKQA